MVRKIIQSGCLVILAHQILRSMSMGVSISLVNISVFVSGGYSTSLYK